MNGRSFGNGSVLPYGHVIPPTGRPRNVLVTGGGGGGNSVVLYGALSNGTVRRGALAQRKQQQAVVVDDEVMVMRPDSAAVDQEDQEEDETIRLKPVKSIYLGKTRFFASSVEFTRDRIMLNNLHQKPVGSGKYNITVPYREIDAFRYCFRNGVSLIIVQPIYPSYVKLAQWSKQAVRPDTVPENFLMIHAFDEPDIHEPGQGKFDDATIERIRRWADADVAAAKTAEREKERLKAAKAGVADEEVVEVIDDDDDDDCNGVVANNSKVPKKLSNGIKFSAISSTFANNYLSTPNRSIKKVCTMSGPFSISKALANAASTTFTKRTPAKATTHQSSEPEIILVDDDDDVVTSTTTSTTSSTTNNSTSKTTNSAAGATIKGDFGGDRAPANGSLLDKVVLKYPPEEKSQISLYGRDLLCIRDGQYLNDNIVNFYLKYYQKHFLAEHLRGKIFIYDALFATHLIQPKKRKFEVKDLKRENFVVFQVETMCDTYHKTLKSWTKNVDIFSYDYLFIPFIRDQHWFLVILCNIYNLLPRGQTARSVVGTGASSSSNSSDVRSSSFFNEQSQPTKPVEQKKATIIFMDSLNKHSTLDNSPSSNTFAILKYLECEYREKYQCSEPATSTSTSSSTSSSSTTTTFTSNSSNLRPSRTQAAITSLGNYEVLSPKVPQQTNFYDCGLFALEYIERFLKDPEKVLAQLKSSASSLTKWFEPRDLKMKRSKIHQTIVNLMPPDDVKQLEEELDELQMSRGDTLPPPSFYCDDELY